MNCNFVRRVTSSFIASLFALSVGISSVKPVKSQEVGITNTCEKKAYKFNIPLADKQPLKIAVSNSVNTPKSEAAIQSPNGKITILEYEFKGLGNILAGKLSEDSNFRITDWNRIKPVYPENERDKRPEISQNQINLKDLHKLRDDYGIEAVLFVTVNDFQVNGTKAKNYYLLGTKQELTDVYVTLNFRLIDTTTGDIVDSGKGDGHQNESYTSEITTPTIAVGDIQLSPNASKPSITIKFDSQHNITKNSKEGVENKLLAVAVEDAINQLIEELSLDYNETSCLLRIPTMIADIEENQVIINKGKLHGYCENITLSVEHSPKAVIDPYSGRFLFTKTKPIPGVKIEIIEVKPDYSVGKITYISGKVVTKVIFAKRQLFVKRIPSKENICSENKSQVNSNENALTQNSTNTTNSQVSREADKLKVE